MKPKAVPIGAAEVSKSSAAKQGIGKTRFRVAIGLTGMNIPCSNNTLEYGDYVLMLYTVAAMTVHPAQR